MKSEHCHNLFERLSGQPFASTGIRPGGLGLTRRGIALSRLVPDDVVLDIGCGTGVTVEHLICERSIRALGIDSSPALVSRGRARSAGLQLLLGDAEALPFADGSFHGVFLECTLSLVSNRDQALKECYRVLSPRGRIIVSDIFALNKAAINGLKSLPVRSCLRGALDKDQFLHECSAAGFGFGCFEDHSYLLRDFAVQMIWMYGSLDRFWTHEGGCTQDACQVQGAIREARPGYFLSVGFKSHNLHGFI
jgi:arsenite methyltransferase